MTPSTKFSSENGDGRISSIAVSHLLANLKQEFDILMWECEALDKIIFDIMELNPPSNDFSKLQNFDRISQTILDLRQVLDLICKNDGGKLEVPIAAVQSKVKQCLVRERLLQRKAGASFGQGTATPPEIDLF
jgi:hypothetical protein